MPGFADHATPRRAPSLVASTPILDCWQEEEAIDANDYVARWLDEDRLLIQYASAIAVDQNGSVRVGDDPQRTSAGSHPVTSRASGVSRR
jgi:hypothetical protein